MTNTSRIRERFLLFLAILVLGVIVAYPLAKIVIQSFKFDQHFSFQNYIRAFLKKGNFVAPIDRPIDRSGRFAV